MGALLLAGTDRVFSQPPLKVGALVPFTGRHGDSGRECARGILDAARGLNQRGGIYGRRLEIVLVDDSSQTAETIAAYRKLNETDNILLLYVYLMDTAISLSSHIQYNRLPTLASALPSHLSTPSKHPYLFSLVPTPLDQAKIGITYLSEKLGTRARKPRIVFIGSSDYSDQHFLDEAKLYAKNMGLDVPLDLFFPGPSSFKEHEVDPKRPSPTISLLSPMKEYECDFAYLSLNPKEVSLLLRDAGKTGTKVRWICNSRAFDETLSAFEGVLGVQPVAPFGEDIPGMTDIKEAHQRWHPYDNHTLSYVEGWATVRIMAEALRRSLPESQLSRERMKLSLESFRNYVVGGLVPPITFTADDHRPSVESRIFMIRGGKIRRQTDFISVGRQMRKSQ